MLGVLVVVVASTMIDVDCPSNPIEQFRYWMDVIVEVDRKQINTSSFLQLKCLNILSKGDYEFFKTSFDKKYPMLKSNSNVNDHFPTERTPKEVFSGKILKGDITLKEYLNLTEEEYEEAMALIKQNSNQLREGLQKVFYGFGYKAENILAFFDRLISNPGEIQLSDVFSTFEFDGHHIKIFSFIGGILKGESVTYELIAQTIPISQWKSFTSVYNGIRSFIIDEDCSLDKIIEIVSNLCDFVLHLPISIMNLLKNVPLSIIISLIKPVLSGRNGSQESRLQSIRDGIQKMFPTNVPFAWQYINNLTYGSFHGKSFLEASLGEHNAGKLLDLLKILSKPSSFKNLLDLLDISGDFMVQEFSNLYEKIINDDVTMNEILKFVTDNFGVPEISSIWSTIIGFIPHLSNVSYPISEIPEINDFVVSVLNDTYDPSYVQDCVKLMKEIAQTIQKGINERGDNEFIYKISKGLNETTIFYDLIRSVFSDDLVTEIKEFNNVYEKFVLTISQLLKNHPIKNEKFALFFNSIVNRLSEICTMFKKEDTKTEDIIEIFYYDPKDFYIVLKNTMAFMYVNKISSRIGFIGYFDLSFIDIPSTIENILAIEIGSFHNLIDSIVCQSNKYGGIIKKIMGVDFRTLFELGKIGSIVDGLSHDLATGEIKFRSFIGQLVPIDQFIDLMQSTKTIYNTEYPASAFLIQMSTEKNTTNLVESMSSLHSAFMSDSVSLSDFKRLGDQLIVFEEPNGSDSNNPTIDPKRRPFLWYGVIGFVCIAGIIGYFIFGKKNNQLHYDNICQNSTLV